MYVVSSNEFVFPMPLTDIYRARNIPSAGVELPNAFAGSSVRRITKW